MKGIVLAGGAGSRLAPMTWTTSKQLLPVYDKPMIYYPLSTLMLAGVREILLISTPRDLPRFEELLGKGDKWGLDISYAAQPQPRGIAEALIIAKPYLAGAASFLTLGDNILYGHGLPDILKQQDRACRIFCHQVRDPNRYGVIELDGAGQPLSLAEKPAVPRSNLAVIGLYQFDQQAPDIAASIKPSPRGELEITDVIQHYLDQRTLCVEQLGRGFAWFDSGTPDSLLEAAEFVRTLEHRQGVNIACLEEIAFHNGWIDDTQVASLARTLSGSDYGRRLARLLEPGKA